MLRHGSFNCFLYICKLNVNKQQFTTYEKLLAPFACIKILLQLPIYNGTAAPVKN